MKSFLIIATLLLFPISQLSAAEKLPEPKVEYSADMYLESNGNSLKSRQFHGLGGKERQEMEIAGGQTIIMRLDKKVAWMLMPEQKSYMEVPLGEAKKRSADLRECLFDQKSAGAETVNGIKTNKSTFSAVCKDDMHYDGTMWVTKEGIMVKMDGKISGKAKGNIKIELKNLKIGKQDVALFEIPSGYKKMDIGMMINDVIQQMNGAKHQKKPSTTQNTGRDYTSEPRESGRDYTSEPRDTGRDFTAQPKESNKEKSPIPGIDIKDGVNTLKKLFKW